MAPPPLTAGDRRPRQVMVRFAAMLLRVPRYLKLAYNLARDGRLTPAERALATLGAAYTISPLDPLPGFIPVIGQLDDLAVLLLTLRRALRSSPPELAEDHLARVGLSFTAIEADLATVRATAIWVARETSRLVGRSALRLARFGTRQMLGALARLRAGRPVDQTPP